MNQKIIKHTVSSVLFLCSIISLHAKDDSLLRGVFGDFDYKFSGVYRPEMFFGKNIALLNNNNDGDKVWFMRHTLDFRFDLLYGEMTYGTPVAEFFFTVRNRATWGNPNVAQTTEAESKFLDTVGRPHTHFIPRIIFWMREIWLSFDLGAITGLDFCNEHAFQIGAFPFQLGRGIALGDAFATGPSFLGFYTDFNVDQYAFGAKITGQFIPKVLFYDLYAGLLSNRSASLGDTGAKVRGQEFGRLETPARGFGVINYVAAARVIWRAFDNERLGKLDIEPYVLFNNDPEQEVEFLADATSKLGTFGLAAEYYGSRFEIGFDGALNIGQQRVKGWDRNQIITENRGGQVIIVNSQVVDQNNQHVPFVSGSPAQRIIFDTFRNASQNGQVIGTVENVGFIQDQVTLRNSDVRFRNPNTNEFEGYMFVIDGSVWLYKHDISISAAAGVASGDRNPNEEELDSVYSGFIGLQEIYSGKRVRSAFVLGGAGKLRRPLARPDQRRTSVNRFPTVVDRFTNLIYTGGSFYCHPSEWENDFSFMPNLLFYWEEKPSLRFDAQTKQILPERASPFLGTEINVFMHYYPFPLLKIFFVGSIFLPGQHYRDIEGLPLDAAQEAILDRLDKTGFSQDRIPNLGHDTAYTFNLGVEMRF